MASNNWEAGKEAAKLFLSGGGDKDDKMEFLMFFTSLHDNYPDNIKLVSNAVTRFKREARKEKD